MLIDNRRDYLRLCDRVANLGPDELLGLDTESTGVELYTKDVLRGVCIGFGDESYYVPVSHPGDSWNVGDTSFLRRALQQTRALPVFHNAPFDFRSLEAGIGYAPPMSRYRDTMVLSWLEDENRRKGLKFLGARFFGDDEAAEAKYLKELFAGESQAVAYRRLRQELAATGGKESAAATKIRAAEASAASKVSWATITAEQIAPYAAKDAELTLRVYDYLLKHPEYAEIEPAVKPLHDVQAAAYRMTRHGVQVSEGRIIRLSVAAFDRAAEIADEFDINIASTPQLAKLVYETWGLAVTERTETGTPSTAAAVLEAMAGEHPGLDLILEYRRNKKAEAFYDGLLLHSDADNRVHSGFNVVGTVTGRWSSSNPNLAQIPRASTNKDAKSVFVAPPGYVLIGFDLASAELRVAASIAGDERMIAALSEPGRSMHKETSRAVFGSEEDPYYTLGKALNFSIPYGVGPKKFAAMMAKGLKQAQSPKHYRQAKDAIDAHRAAWPELHAAINNCTAYAETAGRLPLGWDGRIRHFMSDVMEWPVPAYQAFNSAVQGGVALFVNDVLLAIEPVAAELGAVPILSVYDALSFECPPDSVAELERRLQLVSNELNPWQLPMLWEMKVGI